MKPYLTEPYLTSQDPTPPKYKNKTLPYRTTLRFTKPRLKPLHFEYEPYRTIENNTGHYHTAPHPTLKYNGMFPSRLSNN